MSCRRSFKTHVHTRRPFGTGSHNCIVQEVLVVGTWTSSSKHKVYQHTLFLTLSAGLLSPVKTVIFIWCPNASILPDVTSVACLWNGGKALLQTPALCYPLCWSINFYARVQFTRKEYCPKALPVNWRVMKVQSCFVFCLLRDDGHCSVGKQ